MTIIEQAQQLLAQAEALNGVIREAKDTITLSEARQVTVVVRHTEDWLLGIRKLLMLWSEISQPDDETH